MMTIGSNNVFEVDARIEAMKIGDYNVIEPKGLFCVHDYRDTNKVFGESDPVRCQRLIQFCSYFFFAFPTN